MTDSDNIYDFIAIGLGPFNLSLACLAEPIDQLDGLVLEQCEGFDWHPGLMLEDATLQTPFLSDLVTLADPTHRLSFLNYLKQQGRLYAFYIRENFFLLRREYNQYCQWAAAQLDSVRFNTRVDAIEHDASLDAYRIRATDTRNNRKRHFFARRLVLGTGPSPYMPPCCERLGAQAIHASQYLKNKPSLQAGNAITVVGSGQSAAEIFYDLLGDIDQHEYALHWITRSPRFFPLEYSKLTLEMTSPEYVDYFYALPAHQRQRLITEQTSLYKGINGELINAIFDRLYQKRLLGPLDVRLMTNCELTHAQRQTADHGLSLTFHQREQDAQFRLHTASLVLATGYRYRPPAFLQGIASRIRWDDQGRFRTHRHYAIDHAGEEIFVQNAELPTHGFVTPDLGMACYRNAHLIRSMTGVEHYPIEQRIAFQQFAAPAQDQRQRLAS